VADLNGDTRPDLLVVDTLGIKVFLAEGDGTFQPPISVGETQSLRSFAVGDFNRDGRPDLAVVRYEGNDVSIRPGDGTGRFGPARLLGLSDAVFVAAGDVDHDGSPDLAVLESGERVTIWIGDGTGAFQRSKEILISPPMTFDATFVGIDDVDGDGRADLITSRTTPSEALISVYPGDGKGGFASPRTSSAGAGYVNSVALGDFNHDAHLDLAATNGGANDGAIVVLLGDGSGAFALPISYVVGASPNSVVAADFNVDGNLDLAVANNGSGARILYGEGTGQFLAGPVFLSTAVSVAAADFDGDGRTDLALCGVALSIVLNSGGGHFATAAEFGGVRQPSALASEDFDGDGDPDVAVANYDSDDVSVFLGDGRGGFKSVRRFPVGREPVRLAVGDFTGDGMLDLAVANQSSQDISVFAGAAGGSFSPAGAVALPGRPVAMETGDFNADGKLDLVVATPTALVILLGDGTGRFTPAGSTEVGMNPTSVVVGDFDRNGRLDVALANFGPYPLPNDYHPQPGGAVTVFFGDGGGGFAASTQVLSGSPTSLTAADINRDGNLDLIVSKADLALLVGDGRGHFSPPQAVELGSTSPAGQVRVGDFNSDGLPDLAVSTAAAEIAILYGRGSGGFGIPAKFLAAAGSMALGDFDRDGRTDIVSGGAFPSVISMLLNTACVDRPPVVRGIRRPATRAVGRPDRP